MTFVARVEQLHRYSYAISKALNGAFNYCIDIQFVGNSRQRLARLLVLHCRGSRNHPQSANSSEISDQRFCHPVGQVVLGRIAAEIGQRQNRQRPYRQLVVSRIAVRMSLLYLMLGGTSGEARADA